MCVRVIALVPAPSDTLLRSGWETEVLRDIERVKDELLRKIGELTVERDLFLHGGCIALAR